MLMKLTPGQPDLPSIGILRPLLILYYDGCLQGALKEDRITKQEQMSFLTSSLSKKLLACSISFYVFFGVPNLANCLDWVTLIDLAWY